jgi:uncharacterized protein YdeI (YjbR/CyaY-like superfamily)
VKPKFFRTPDAFRQWLEKHHATERELLVGFYRKSTGRQSITWKEAVDQALCFGWIDGVRRSIDADSYYNRFTPRKRKSNWSRINIARVDELIAEGLMRPSGLAAFEARDAEADAKYSFERENVQLDGEYAKRLRANEAAAGFFYAQPPSYRKTATWWVISAKREETRLRRLQQLIDDSAAGRRIGPMRRKADE